MQPEDGAAEGRPPLEVIAEVADCWGAGQGRSTRLGYERDLDVDVAGQPGIGTIWAGRLGRPPAQEEGDRDGEAHLEVPGASGMLVCVDVTLA